MAEDLIRPQVLTAFSLLRELPGMTLESYFMDDTGLSGPQRTALIIHGDKTIHDFMIEVVRDDPGNALQALVDIERKPLNHLHMLYQFYYAVMG